MTTVRAIWRGLFWTDECGSHPGTVHLVVFVGIGAVGSGWIGSSFHSAPEGHWTTFSDATGFIGWMHVPPSAAPSAERTEPAAPPVG